MFMSKVFSSVGAWVREYPLLRGGLLSLCLGVAIFYIALLILVILTQPWWAMLLVVAGTLCFGGWISIMLA
jgi:hypothetical protein